MRLSWCRLHLHRWRAENTLARLGFETCTRCGKTRWAS